MMKRYAFWAAAAAIALTACGGGSSSDSPPEFVPEPVPAPAPAPEPAPAPAPEPAPAPAPAKPYSKDRIEPLDTALLLGVELKKEAGSAPKRVLAGVSMPRVSLGPFSGSGPSNPAKKIGPLKIGDGREIPVTARFEGLASILRWQPTAEGGYVAGIEFYSEGARAVRLGVLVDSIPDGTVLRFYGEGDRVSEATSAQLARMRSRNEAGGILGDSARMYWGADTAGPISTMEIHLPPGTSPDHLRLAVPLLSHLYRNPALRPSMQKSTSDIGLSKPDNHDVMCRSDMQAESRSIAKMVFTLEDGRARSCTGTLLNDSSNSQTPYFLTANHCVSNQYQASTLQTYWFFRAAGCNRSPHYDQAMTIRAGGADFLFGDPDTDITLLRLNDRPPANVVYAGSYFGEGAGPGLDVSSVHHPEGDLQKYSDGQVESYIECGKDLRCWRASDDSFSFLSVQFRTGISEPGSSGAPLFLHLGQTRYVAGTQYGYLINCLTCNGHVGVYGRFELAFPKGINRWLTP